MAGRSSGSLIQKTRSSEWKGLTDKQREANRLLGGDGGEAIFRTPQIGMTPEQVIHDTYLGQPDTVNRTVTAAGAREQWVYGAGQYLYFEGGRLVAMQTRRSAQ